ncbi:MAG: hypothetical protein WD688_09865 [Candidatus Binatia bacterium]
MSNQCVYCGARGSLTREHIIPRSILERVPQDSMRYIESAEKVILNDPVIKDVCKACNEGVLSELDAYGSQLFDRHFCNPPAPKTTITFTYEFNRLARWLLKISFNSARASKHSDADVLRLYVPDVLNGTTPDISVCLELIEPSVNEAETDSGIVVVQTVNPTTLRISHVQLKDGFVPSLHIVRLIAIQAYWFALVIPTAHNHPETERRSELGVIISKWPGISVLPRDADSISLTTLGNDIVEMSKDNILTKIGLYQDAMRRMDAKRKDA